jgi:hypothetical protein
VGIGVSFEELPPETAVILVAKLFTHAYENLGKATVSRPRGLGIWKRIAGGAAAPAAPSWSMLTGREAAVSSHGVRPDFRRSPADAYPRLWRPRALRLSA